MVEVIAFASPFTHAREYRETTMLNGDIADQFHHVDSLAYTRTTK